jgi:sensor histidine kinase regulating citrate/malate metabolism
MLVFSNYADIPSDDEDIQSWFAFGQRGKQTSTQSGDGMGLFYIKHLLDSYDIDIHLSRVEDQNHENTCRFDLIIKLKAFWLTDIEEVVLNDE